MRFCRASTTSAESGARPNVCPCAFPPGLPAQITGNFVNKYRKLLKAELREISKTNFRTGSVMSLGVEQSHRERNLKGRMQELRQRQQRGKSEIDSGKPA